MRLSLSSLKPRSATQQTVIFEVTARCNHDCLYCYNVWKGPRPSPAGELDTRSAKRLLDTVLDQTGCSLLTFSGGEPLLRDDLCELISLVHRRGVGVNMITNGSRLDDETVKQLIEAGVTLFEVSLLSSNREVHNSLTRSNSFDSVVEGIANIRLHRGRVVVATVLTALNATDLEETLQLAFALGADGVLLNRFNPGGTGIANMDALMPDVHTLREALLVADRAAADLEMPISSGVPLPPCVLDRADFPHLSFGYCAAGTANAYYTVDPTGNLRMCNHSPMVLGNLFDSSFARLIESKAANRFLSAVPSRCRGCGRLDECRASCRAAAEQCFGTPEAADPILLPENAARSLPRHATV